MTGPRTFVAPAAPMITGDRDDWRLRGNCATQTERSWEEVDRIFNPTGDEHTSLGDAKPICRPCPVRAECLVYALADSTIHGIWAATTTAQRINMRRNEAKWQRRRARREDTT